MMIASVLSDGLAMLSANAWATAVLLGTLFGLGAYVLVWLVPAHSLDAPARVLAAVGVGSTLLVLAAGLLLTSGCLLPDGLARLLGLGIFLLAALLGWRALGAGFFTGLRPVHAWLAGALLLLLVIRYAFLARILLPPYSDSAFHYQIVMQWLQPTCSAAGLSQPGLLLASYYHTGYHALAAWLSLAAGIAPAQAIALLGQVFLALAPLSLAALVLILARDGHAAWSAGLAAAIGWLMPSFAVNWGKYPAVASLAVLPAVMGMLYVLPRKPSGMGARVFLALALTAGLGWIHTRAVIVLALALACAWLARRLHPAQKRDAAPALRFSLLFLLSLLPLAQLLRDFYSTLPLAAAAVLLLPFAFASHPRIALGIFFFIFAAWVTTLVHLPLADGPVTLLDRQYLEIVLAGPFSILVGAGFSGLRQRLPASGFSRAAAGLLLAGVVVVSFARANALYPDHCCTYYGQDDQQAFAWLATLPPDESLVLIPVFRESGQAFGTDAGVWVSPLLGLKTNKLLYQTDWGVPAAVRELCAAGAGQVYVYSGGRAFSFQDDDLDRSGWFEQVFRSGSVAVFRLARCP